MSKRGSPHRAFNALSKVLVKLGLIDERDLLREVDSVEQQPIAFYSGRGKFEESDAVRRVADALGLECVVFSPQEIERVCKLFEHPALDRLKSEGWRELGAIPISIEGRELKIVVANPLQHEEIRALEFDLEMQVRVAIAEERKILAVIARKFGSDGEFNLESILGFEEREPSVVTQAQSDELSTNCESDVEAAPVIKVVNKIFADAVLAGASDIHMNPERDGLEVRVRVDGIMRNLFRAPERVKASVISRIKLLCQMDISERRRPQDGRLRIKTEVGVKDLRVSTVPTPHGENLVARVLSSDLHDVSLDQIGMPSAQREQLERLLLGSSRVVLVCGPTGSGTTSTLEARRLHLHDGEANIITVEDPIEYRIDGITQIQVNPKIEMTFAQGLRSILRQDPDVIMVGEIRDRETAQISMQAAQTGHLVLSTLHTNSAPAAVTRLVDLGVPEYIIASSLGGVVAQRLVRRLCDDCKQRSELTAEDSQLELTGVDTFFPVGCASCGKTGYRGRIALFSVLAVDDEMRAAVRDGKGELEIGEIARKRGYCSLTEAGIAEIAAGRTSVSEVERVLGDLNVEPNDVPEIKSCDSDSLQRHKLLVVDDDYAMGTVLSRLLEREMYEVQHVSSGRAALEQVFNEIPSLIVADLMMPEMSGLEMVERLRSDPRTAAIPILMLTAVDTSETELSAMSGGADDFVSKTADSKILLARVRRLLARTSNA